jgi:hypothetical protein
MIKQLVITELFEALGHVQDFRVPEYTITPTLDGYWVQGVSRAALLPKSICVLVFEGSNVPIPDYVGAIVPAAPERAPQHEQRRK